MIEQVIPWSTGGGNVVVSYEGKGKGELLITSPDNPLWEDRSMTIIVETTAGSPEKAETIVLTQKGKTLAVGTEFNFDYTGAVQSVELPKGKYKLQCWGAQGGDVTGTYAVKGSKGGYSEGVLTLTEKTTLYIFVGSQGTSYTSSASQTSTALLNGGWNGGGAGARTLRYTSTGLDVRSFPRGGGGATDIALVSSSMSYSSGRTVRSASSLASRIIVAGGGAGASASYTSKTTTTTTNVSTVILNEIVNFEFGYTQSSGRKIYWAYRTIKAVSGRKYVYSGTQNTTLEVYAQGIYVGGSLVGSSYTPTADEDIEVRCYARGEADSSVNGTATLKVTETKPETTTTTTTSSSKSTQAQQGGGDSGRGQCPGKSNTTSGGGAYGVGANQSSLKTNPYHSGAGGGGWYGGGCGNNTAEAAVSYAGGGSGFVNIAKNSSYLPNDYSGLQLDSGTTKDGATSFESISGGTETGHSGDGCARITVIA